MKKFIFATAIVALFSSSLVVSAQDTKKKTTTKTTTTHTDSTHSHSHSTVKKDTTHKAH